MALTLIKGDSVTIRIDSRTRFGVDLLARLGRTTVTEVISQQIRERLAQALPKCDVDGREVGLLDAVWDEYEQDRMVKLAVHAPDLLSPEEQKLWRVISEDRKYLPKSGRPNFAAIRDNWRLIKDKVKDYEDSAKEP